MFTSSYLFLWILIYIEFYWLVYKVHAIIKNDSTMKSHSNDIHVLTLKYLWSTTDVIC